jgi:hypothetical protein
VDPSQPPPRPSSRDITHPVQSKQAGRPCPRGGEEILGRSGWGWGLAVADLGLGLWMHLRSAVPWMRSHSIAGCDEEEEKKKVADPSPYDEMRYGGRRSVMHACMRYSLQLLKAGGWRWFQTVLHVYLLFLDAIP